ncbi:unnamed protein product [marine sediment metagenome]|uniref:Uncharacterized protein n=1 Tax=marine sediment metagenome TaxID=412755 RepID=X1PES5_9ZZZZ
MIDNKLPVKDLWMPWVAFGITLYAGCVQYGCLNQASIGPTAEKARQGDAMPPGLLACLRRQALGGMRSFWPG